MYRTGAVVAVLSALDDVRWRFPTQVAVSTGLGPPGVSKILARLERAGLVESRWEEPEEAASADGEWGRQRRHYFRLTAPGLRQALEWKSPPK